MLAIILARLYVLQSTFLLVLDNITVQSHVISTVHNTPSSIIELYVRYEHGDKRPAHFDNICTC